VRGRFLAAAAFLAAMISVQDVSAANLGYDPKADPFEDYQNAIAAAAAEDKLVLVIAGGDWCRWCHVLNRFVARHPDVQQGLEETFVVVKVYVGDENYNTDFFEQLPRALGAPHFWIIAPDRNVLASQSTGALEHGERGYDKDKFLDFIDRKKDLNSASVGSADPVICTPLCGPSRLLRDLKPVTTLMI
jgi:Thioredoxin-like